MSAKTRTVLRTNVITREKLRADRSITSDKGEADAKLQKKLLEMLDEALFEIAFFGHLPQAQKIEVVRIFDNLLGELRLWCRKRSLKVR